MKEKFHQMNYLNFIGCFLTGTAAEVTPVSQIAKNNYKVCDTIIDLSKSYEKLVRKKKLLNLFCLQILRDLYLFLNIHNQYIKLEMQKTIKNYANCLSIIILKINNFISSFSS